MKKSLIILLILVITAVAGAGWAAADVNKAKDQIEIEEVALVGDRSMAEGLTVRARNTYDHHLFWDTVYTMEKSSAKAETEFRFSAMRENEVWFSEDEGVHLDSYYVFGFEPGSGEEEPIHGLGKAYQELYDTLEPGEEARRVINVRDYLDYYPLHVELDAPGAGFYYMDDEEAYQVLDAEFETKELKQKLSICDWPEDGYGWWLYEYEDFLAAAVPQDRLMVVSRDKDGMYHLDLLVPVDHDEEDDYPMYLNYNEAMAFDGGKLAVVPIFM